MSLGVGAADISGPTSTTKAMLINIVCPRRIGHESTTEPDADKVGNKGDDVKADVDSKVTKIIFEAENDLGVVVEKNKVQETQEVQEPKAKDSTPETQSKSASKLIEGTPKRGNSRKTLKIDQESPSIELQEDVVSPSLSTVEEEDSPSKENVEADVEPSSSKKEATDDTVEQMEAEAIEDVSEAKIPEDTTAGKSTIEEKVAAEVASALIAGVADEDSSDLFVTPEEAAAVTPMVVVKEADTSTVGGEGDGDLTEADKSEIADDNNSVVVSMEINMEELLRIAFDNLLKEWHLLNVPMFSYVDSQQRKANNDEADDDGDHEKEKGEIAKKGTSGSGDSSRKDEAAWIFLQVMARPNSLGIILEKLERIGVGVNCGTVSIFKVELCKTASPYAHMKQQEEEESKRQQEEEEQKQKKLEQQESLGRVKVGESDGAGKDETKENGSNQSGIKDADAAEGTKIAEPTEDGSKKAADSNKRALDDSHTGSSSHSTTAATATNAKLKEKELQQERVAAERRIEAARAEWKNAATRLRIEQVREQIAEQVSANVSATLCNRL